MTKERVKLLVKIAAKRVTTDPQTYSVKVRYYEGVLIYG